MIKFATNLLTRFCTIETISREQKKISKFQLKNFSDSVKIAISAGNGGNGSVAFFTDKRVRRGAPDGGEGGEGGDIVVQAHQSLHDLSHLRLKNIKGNDGDHGRPTGRDGKRGGKTLLRVPQGTLVFEIKENLEGNQAKTYLTDLNQNGQSLILCKGGSSGKGNKMHPFMKPEERMGKQGQSKIVYFQLKMLAHIGLVGFPNVGKSTFLASSTRALPKIANYDFTTLKPSVGYVKFVDDVTMTIADIPGIIQNAHLNKGLGLQFLRHIERTQILIFVLDISRPDPLEHYFLLEKQLFAYKDNIFKDRQRVIAFNKKDCIENSSEKFIKYSSQLSYPSFLISAKEGQGVGQLLVHLRKMKQTLQKEEEMRKDSEPIEMQNQKRKQEKKKNVEQQPAINSMEMMIKEERKMYSKQ